ncbi:tRNA (Guanine37-N(1)-) methyltransferase [Rubrobacter radiotolerans DSM 5868]|uniref:tRNA (guanosine(37)-N1)-methyltransferase TrmD n=1 Tax=Rubrobacter radiotolerans TaxID=42256 RepID=UPI0009CB8B08|nr:tRNA (guanosine(37)-N1)-methyltransferase TrmD [Rubrobacter radiotolerans]SMC05165.1 tRNA (Guanine37-N(1)-) methyltransferase [Rubrobacter radiotolerans DSM 5868]
MRSVDVFCVFPEAVDAIMRVGVIGKAIETGLVEYRSFSFRDFVDPGKRIDDAPYGGGAGMVIRVDVVARAFREVYGVPAREVREGRRVVITEPGGRRLDQGYAGEVARGPDVTLVCGRYGGIDGRVREHLCTEAVSIGDFVLSGGEIVALALADAAIRQIPGVLGNSESLLGESFSSDGFIGPPVYTRPAEWDGAAVPGVLLSGDHARVRAWRESASSDLGESTRAAERPPDERA